jgi:hypothetical protein
VPDAADVPSRRAERAGHRERQRRRIGTRGVLAPGLPTSRQVACANGAPIGNASSTSPAGASTLTYDPTTDTYVYVWKTDAAWKGTCRELAVGLPDGTVHRTVISFG